MASAFRFRCGIGYHGHINLQTCGIKRRKESILPLKRYGSENVHILHAKASQGKNIGRINGSGRSRNEKGDNMKDLARAALERVLLQAQKIEEDSAKLSGVDLESDLKAALTALKDKEEQLQDAQRAALLGRSELELARKNLEAHKEEIASTKGLQRRLEEELCKMREDFIGQKRELEEANLQVVEKEKGIVAIQHKLGLKEKELEDLHKNLMMKDKEIMKVSTDLKFKEEALINANEVIARQNGEMKELRKFLEEKERLLIEAEERKKEDEKKLRIAESELENRMVAWFLVLEDMKRLAKEASKNNDRYLATEEELKSARNVLIEVKGQLSSSEKLIEASKQRAQSQEAALGLKRAELLKQKDTISSYEVILKGAQMQVLTEKERLTASQNDRLEVQRLLNIERDTVAELQWALQQEKKSLAQAIEEVDSLRRELEQRNVKFSDTQTLVQLKESELVAARLEMQKLKSEVSSLQCSLDEKDSGLSSARRNLETLHTEFLQLKTLMRTKEDQLLKTSQLLKEKEEHVTLMKLDLNDNKNKLLEASSVVERIAELTRVLVDSAKEDKKSTVDEYSLVMEANTKLFSTSRKLVETKMQLEHIQEMSVDDLRKRKHAEAELGTLRDCLREKENELLESQRDLALKNEELNKMVDKWKVREKELDMMREEILDEANSLNTLHSIVQKRIGDKTFGEIALEQLQLEAAHVDVEAAMTALRNLTNLSHQLVSTTKTSLDLSSDNFVVSRLGMDPKTGKDRAELPRNDLSSLEMWLSDRDAAMERTKMAVKNLSNLTMRLVKEAGVKRLIVSDNGYEVVDNDHQSSLQVNTQHEIKASV